MRLIRLTTTDTACVFDNYFNTDILIPPQSKIALQNLSFELRSGFLTIAAENASIVYTAANGINKTATLQHKSYTINQVNILLDDIRVALNNSLSVVTGSLGMEWFADAVNDKVHLLQKQLYFDEQLTTVRTIEVAQSAPGSANGYKVYKGNNIVTENNQYIHWQTEWSKGCPKFSTKVYTAPSTNTENFRIALLTTNSEITYGNTISEDSIKYSITCPSNNGDAYYKCKSQAGQITTAYNLGSWIATDFPNNDKLELYIEEGQVIGRITLSNDTSTRHELFSEPYTDETLYPVIIYYHSNGGSSAVLVTLKDIVRPAGAPTTHQESVAKLDRSLEMDKSLAKALGFEAHINHQKQVQFIDLTGDYEIQYLADAFVVMLQDLKLESFDGHTHQRSNILAVVTAPNQQGSIKYEVGNLVFVNISNNRAITLRNIRARILTADLQPVEVEGLSSITLLLD